MDWPPDYLAEYQRRLRLINAANADSSVRSALQTIYRTDPVKWMNDWCVTYDPRNLPPAPKIMPFVLFPRQVDMVQFLLYCYLEKRNGLIEKARDMGATWIGVCFTTWLWLYHPGAAIGWGSRKEEYVDRAGDLKAIFPKMRMLLDYLPGWMKPAGYNPAKHATYMRLLNPANGANVVGEAGDNQGRGGRTSIYFTDEDAHQEHPELIEAALGDNTDVHISISSVNGTNNVFYRRRMAGVVWENGLDVPREKVAVFIMDWRDHPAKTQEWYETRRAKAEAEGLMHLFAQEVDRDYSGAVERVIIPQQWVRASVDAHLVIPKKWGWAVPIEGERIAMQDVADGGGDKNGLVARHGILCTFADHWAGEAQQAAHIAVPVCVQEKVNELYYDSIGVGVGFKVETNNMMQKPNWPKSLRVMAWNAGAPPLDPDSPVIPGDANSPTNKEQYANLKAQAWFRVRARFYKTYRAVLYGEKYDPADLISIDSRIMRLNELCLELSQAVRKDTGEGETAVDKKPDGATSPNLADAFIGCYNPTRELSILDVL